jgi:hypothetical protein
LKTAEGVLPYGGYNIPTIEADMKLEYLPFAAAKYEVNANCSTITGNLRDMCGLMLEQQAVGLDQSGYKINTCDCWMNLPAFRSGSFTSNLVDSLAASFKVPSRISTYGARFWTGF